MHGLVGTAWHGLVGTTLPGTTRSHHTLGTPLHTAPWLGMAQGVPVTLYTAVSMLEFTSSFTGFPFTIYHCHYWSIIDAIIGLIIGPLLSPEMTDVTGPRCNVDQGNGN